MYKCPTWTWESGEPSKQKKHLPPDKQFLMTRNVPCTARVRSLENVVHDCEVGGLDDDKEEDWLVSRILTMEEQRNKEEEELVDGFDVLDMEDVGEDGETTNTASLSAAASAGVWKLITPGGGKNSVDENTSEEYTNMADFEDNYVMEDEAAVAVAFATVSKTVSSLSLSKNGNNINNNNILKVRSYDISVTYDKYYQTPRVWLMGYTDDGSNRPLTGDEIMEDVMSDYAHRTVTLEVHPHLPGVYASIHPCQHGNVMKTIVRNLTRDCGGGGSGGGGPSVEMYLFIFLKFVSSMIPTISYDFTMDVNASTRIK